MFAFLIPLVGPRLAKPVFYGLLILLIAGAGFTLARCGNRDREAQAEQSVRSADAYSNAVANGVEIIDNRAVTEAALAEATVEIKDEIGNAATLTDIRTSLVTRLCQHPSHKGDPACVR